VIVLVVVQLMGFDESLDSVEDRLGTLEQPQTAVENRLGSIDDRLANIENLLDRLLKL
jgi:Tfp pilus assembly protein PilO